MSEENYNKESVDLRRVVPTREVMPAQVPGDFFWDFDAEYLGGNRTDETHFLYLCLPGEVRCTPIRVSRGSPNGERVWGWDGNEDKPTVTPSIHWVGHWHGFLRNGRLGSC